MLRLRWFTALAVFLGILIVASVFVGMLTPVQRSSFGIDTSSWKLYDHEGTGISFLHPPDWGQDIFPSPDSPEPETGFAFTSASLQPATANNSKGGIVFVTATLPQLEIPIGDFLKPLIENSAEDLEIYNVREYAISGYKTWELSAISEDTDRVDTTISIFIERDNDLIRIGGVAYGLENEPILRSVIESVNVK